MKPPTRNVFHANPYWLFSCPIATRHFASLVYGASPKQKRTVGIYFCLLPDLFVASCRWHTGFSAFFPTRTSRPPALFISGIPHKCRSSCRDLHDHGECEKRRDRNSLFDRVLWHLGRSYSSDFLACRQTRQKTDQHKSSNFKLNSISILMRQVIGGALDDLARRVQPQIFADLRAWFPPKMGQDQITSIILTYIGLSTACRRMWASRLPRLRGHPPSRICLP
jgi:hypothetical protein